METTQKNKRITIVFWGFFVFAMLFFLGYILFILDIGLNSKYFAKRDFNTAFHARTTGNCDKFITYIVQEYKDEWLDRCLEEKNRNAAVPIDQYEVKSISQNDNRAFLQVELARTSASEGTFTYTVNYEMVRGEGKFLRAVRSTRYLINQDSN